VSCDIRFAAADAKLTTSFARLGLVAEHGFAWLLPRLVGGTRARDLLLSGRTVTGAEAESMGLGPHRPQPLTPRRGRASRRNVQHRC
jgi:enoyl-CoA hydratase/carnithine racemase